MLIDGYFGSDLTTDRYDELALMKIGEKFLKGESALMRKKWFDYRHLHPTQATYLFAHHYTGEYRKIYQKIRDVEKGKYATGSKGKDAMQKADTLGFWKGRQTADELMMPYHLYIGSAMRFLIDDNIWQRIPRPNQLYSDKVKEFMREEWANILSYSIIEPQITHLSDDNLFSVECKQEIEKWLCERILERKHPHFGLAHLMFEKKFISEQTAIQFFSSAVIDEARRFHLTK